MTPEQRQRLMDILASGDDVSPEWSRILFPPEKREYELVYHGKERREDIIANTLAVPLQAGRTFNKNGSGWNNYLIFGDNLQAMKTLLEMKRRGELCNADGAPGVRLVYIDPPFATKREFRGSKEQKAYQDKIAGAQFIEFMRKRLVLLYELLAEDGCLYFHLDTKKIHYMKTILDEIFGEEKFVSEIIWKRTSAHSDSTLYANVHDTLLFYSKSSTFTFNQQYADYTEEYVAERYKHIETKGPRKGQAFADGDLVGTGLRGGGYPYDWKGVFKTWRCPIETMQEYDRDNRLYYTRNGVPRIKRYIEDSLGNPVGDTWTDIFPVNSRAAERIDYPTQKSEALLERIIKTSSSKGDIVLDAFAGSGTTCAVAEKLGRRWIGIDCGKLSIYTIQKRLLNLKSDIGNSGKPLTANPFTLYNAGLYDFARLKQLPWEDWRSFALTLFGCQHAPQRIGGICFDGTLKASPVLVFDHAKNGGSMVGEDTLRSIHEAVVSKVGIRVFIIAPAMSFEFQQDYIQIGDVRYYALRVPYSIIHELHQRDFLALQQPTDELAVNDTVDAVGFDFIKTPDMEYSVGIERTKGKSPEQAFIRIDSFYSEASVREPLQKNGNRETLSMVLLDYNYDVENDVFDLDEVFYAGGLEASEWKVRFPTKGLGEKVMAVFLDIYGNEARIAIPSTAFARPKQGGGAKASSRSLK